MKWLSGNAGAELVEHGYTTRAHSKTCMRVGRPAIESRAPDRKVARPIAVIRLMQPSVDGRGSEDAGDGGPRGEGSLAGSGRYRRPVATEIVPFPNSFRAEEYS